MRQARLAPGSIRPLPRPDPPRPGASGAAAARRLTRAQENGAAAGSAVRCAGEAEPRARRDSRLARYGRCRGLTLRGLAPPARPLRAGGGLGQREARRREPGRRRLPLCLRGGASCARRDLAWLDPACRGLARRAPAARRLTPACYSHSIVAGGLEERSRHTRLTAGISLMIRDESVSRRS